MFRRIDKESAQDMLANANVILVDIRDSDSYAAGHLQEALHLTQDNIQIFVAETQKATPVLVMCYHGNSSQSVAHYLTLHGFTEVYSVDGGYEGWVNA